MHSAIERILLSEDQIKARIAELGRELTADYAGKNPIFIGVLKGVVMFFADMIRAIPLDCQIDFMAVSSYGGGTQSSGKIRIQKDISVDLAGRHVVILPLTITEPYGYYGQDRTTQDKLVMIYAEEAVLGGKTYAHVIFFAETHG